MVASRVGALCTIYNLLTFIQPVVIDPLYNDFSALKNKELETKILAIADKADIPAKHVYEVNMSEKTNALNAYVTGIGPNARIVMWDTTLKQLKDKEILFIMAHEMGHYVMKHIYWGVASYMLLSFIGMYLISRIINMCIRKWGIRCKFQKQHVFNFTFIFLNFFCTLFCITASNKLCFSYRRTSGRSICFRHDERREIWCKDVSIFIKNEFKPSKSACVSKVFLIYTPTNF